MMWTDEADGLLIKLWDEGGSLSYVADGLQQAGYDVTRSAVSGRKHRLPQEAFKRTSRAKPIITARPARPSPPQRTKTVTKIPPRRPPTETEVAAIAQHQGIEYLDQTRFGCKAIMPTRGGAWQLQRVCGKPRCIDYNGSNSPYCETHFRIYTNPLATKRHA